MHLSVYSNSGPLHGPPVTWRSFWLCLRTTSFSKTGPSGQLIGNALRDFATAVFGAFEDLKFELKSRVVASDGKSGAMEWTWRGRQTKDLPGLPATNKPFEVRGATVVEFADGRISRDSDYWDLATYMKQVGLTK